MLQQAPVAAFGRKRMTLNGPPTGPIILYCPKWKKSIATTAGLEHGAFGLSPLTFTPAPRGLVNT